MTVVVQFRSHIGKLKLPVQEAERLKSQLEHELGLTETRLEKLKARSERQPDWKAYDNRLGEKWKNRVHLDDLVEIWQTVPHYQEGLAQITVILVCHLADVPSWVLEGEHDPACQTWEGLVSTLKLLYPELQGVEGEALENTIVTCLSFYVLKYL